MKEFHEVKCPDCQTILIVRSRDGKVVEVRRPILEDSTGDRFEDAMIKVRGEKDAVAKKFEEAKAREKDKISRLNKLFDDRLKEVKAEGPVEKPFNPMEMD